jgi:hypothetical protein
MRHIFIVLLFLITFLTSCCKDSDPIIDEDVPTCILDEINEFKSNLDPCDQKGPSVVEYEFQGSIVYSFDMGQCISDGSARILNEFCEELCILGTIVGITDCLGEPFANAVKIRVIWED